MLSLIRGNTIHYHNHPQTQKIYQHQVHRHTLIAQAALRQPHRKISSLRAFSFPDTSEKAKKIAKKFESQFIKNNLDARHCWHWAQEQNFSSNLKCLNKPDGKVPLQLTEADFLSEMEPILALPPRLQSDRLEEYIFEESSGKVFRFSQKQIERLCKILYKLGAYELFIEVFETKMNTFKKKSNWLFLYCNSILKSCYINPNKILNVLSYVPKDQQDCFEYYEIKGLTHVYKCYLAKEVATMFKSRQINNQILEKYFQCFRPAKGSFNESEALGSYERELDRSIAAFEKAIMLECNDQCSMHLIYQLFEASQVKKAYEIANIVYDKFIEDGSDISLFTHFRARAVLTAAIISDADILTLDLVTKRFIATCGAAEQLESIRCFELLGQHIGHPYVFSILEKLKNA